MARLRPARRGRGRGRPGGGRRSAGLGCRRRQRQWQFGRAGPERVGLGHLGAGHGGTDRRRGAAATTATAPAATTDPSLPIGDPRRLPAPQPGELAGVLLPARGICVPALVDLASPGPPEQLALHVPGCAVAQSPSGRLPRDRHPLRAGGTADRRATTPAPAGTAPRGASTAASARGPPVVSDDGAVGTCEFTGPVIDTPRRTRHRPGTCGRDRARTAGLAILQRDRRTLVDAITGRRALRLAAAAARRAAGARDRAGAAA